jgi:mannose-6-phosphate isomerase-like protein (cupin superfamily)
MHMRSYGELQPFIALDGSEIREWAGRVSAPAQNQSLAEAIIAPGAATTEHYHRTSEELYLVTAGEGRLVINGEQRVIGEGDCALIPPGARHKLFNIGAEPLKILCACAPAYAEEDTCLTERAPAAAGVRQRPAPGARTPR